MACMLNNNANPGPQLLRMECREEKKILAGILEEDIVFLLA